MIAVTYLPLFVTILFRGMPGVWQHRHRLVLCWLIVMQVLFPGRKTLEELARWTPGSITVWRLRRVLKAAYWDVHLLVAWWVAEALQTLPPPKDGTLHLVGDGSVKPKRGTQNPLAQKGRKSEHQPWFFGIRFALVIATWDVSRLPVAFRVIRRKTDPAYQTENALFREMVRQFVPPAWATRVIVEGDAAYGSQDNMKMVMQRDADDPARRWGFVFAIARTWKTVEEKAIKDLVTHLPRKYSQRIRVPRLPQAGRQREQWPRAGTDTHRHSPPQERDRAIAGGRAEHHAVLLGPVAAEVPGADGLHRVAQLTTINRHVLRFASGHAGLRRIWPGNPDRLLSFG